MMSQAVCLVAGRCWRGEPGEKRTKLPCWMGGKGNYRISQLREGEVDGGFEEGWKPLMPLMSMNI